MFVLTRIEHPVYSSYFALSNEKTFVDNISIEIQYIYLKFKLIIKFLYPSIDLYNESLFNFLLTDPFPKHLCPVPYLLSFLNIKIYCPLGKYSVLCRIFFLSLFLIFITSSILYSLIYIV